MKEIVYHLDPIEFMPPTGKGNHLVLDLLEHPTASVTKIDVFTENEEYHTLEVFPDELSKIERKGRYLRIYFGDKVPPYRKGFVCLHEIREEPDKKPTTREMLLKAAEIAAILESFHEGERGDVAMLALEALDPRLMVKFVSRI